MAKKKCPECPSQAKWLATFADLNSLLLTFFVLLLSMATLDKVKVRDAFGVLTGGKYILESSAQEDADSQQIIINRAPTPNNSQAVSTQTQEKMMQTLKAYVESQNLQNNIAIVKTPSGFSVRILDVVLFDSGRTTLKPAAFPILNKIAAVAKDSAYNLHVEGHTDDMPMRTPGMSNWDLSTGRAISVVKHFIGQGMHPEKLAATGFAEFQPILPNITPENRARNRRVEVNFVSPEFFDSNKNIFE